MKKSGLFALLLICFAFCESSFAQEKSGQNLIILYTNDLHSRVSDFPSDFRYRNVNAKWSDTQGGFSRIATLIKQDKLLNGDKVLVLDAGDFLMGTFFSMLEESTGFQLSLMKKMGYDAVTLGNHEFDFGPQTLANIITRSAENGYVPQMVASNFKFSKKDTADDALEALFDQKILNTSLVIERNGLRLGIFGLIGKGASSGASRAHPVKFQDPVKAARKQARYLKETEKVDIVICLSHSGIKMDKNGEWSGEDVLLAQKVPEIDLILSAHEHIVLEKPLIVNGTPILLAGSFGAWMGRYELVLEHGKIRQLDSKVIPINDSIPMDEEIQEMIAAQEQLLSEQILEACHLLDTEIIAETTFPLICHLDTLLENSNLGPLIADAVYHYVNRNHHEGTDIAFFPSGLFADNIFPGNTGQQSVGDIFRVIPLGNGKDKIPGYPLARVYVTGRELKGIMEVLYLAPSVGRDYYLYIGGLHATFDPDKGLLRKITSIQVGNPEKGYLTVDCSRKNKELYSITANTYVLEFVSIIKKLSKHLIVVTLKDEYGNPIRSIEDAIIDGDAEAPGIQELKEWMALVWFLQQQPDINGNGIADIPDHYRTGNPALRSE
jgi:5'-nucleotidase / UDP-sugar diphosphatase